MRGLRSTVALLAVLIGLGAYIYFVTSKKSDSDAPTQDKLFTALDSSKIDELKIKSAGGDVTTLKKEGDAWKIVSPVAAPAAGTTASGIANALADMAVVRVVDENPTDVKTFGLEPPRIEVEYKSADGKVAGHLFVGDKTATGGDLYARRDAEKRVVLIAQYLESTINQSTFDLRDKTIIKLDRAKVDGLDVNLDGKVMALAKADGDWKMSKPLVARADSSAAEGLVSHVESVQMKSIVTTTPTPEELKKYGFDKPQATINIHLGTERASLIVGGKVDQTAYYVRDAGKPDVFTVETAATDDLTKPADDYRKKDLFDFRAYNATHVEITKAGQTVVFERVKAKDDKAPDTWHRVSPNPGDPDREKVENLLAGIADIRLTSFVDAKTKTGLDAPVMTVVAKYDDGKREERVTFGKVGADVFAARPDDPGAGKIEAVKFDETSKAVDELSK